MIYGFYNHHNGYIIHNYKCYVISSTTGVMTCSNHHYGCYISYIP